MTPSLTLRRNISCRSLWSTESKNDSMSPSRIQPPPMSIACFHKAFSASCAERPGRNPYEQSRKSCSKTGSTAIFTAL